MLRPIALLLSFLLIPLQSVLAEPDAASDVEHVVLISVDGLRPDAIGDASPDHLPTFHRLQTEGAYTHNARTDHRFSVTLPNHVTQLTGRGVAGALGHHWSKNKDPEAGVTLHSNRGEYVPSVFDVVHDHGGSTGAYVTKSKFVLFDDSYDADSGAPDLVGEDDGRDKIDRFFYDDDGDDVVREFLGDMRADPLNFAFVHLRDPDSAGHIWRWSTREGSRYMKSIENVDEYVGMILDGIQEDSQLAGKTAVILTSDHGGSGWGHGDSHEIEHHRIPFYVWGPGVEQGDLYRFNPDLIQDPGEEHPDYTVLRQPVRNGNAANVAVSLLGLDPVPGSNIGFREPLRFWQADENQLADSPDEDDDAASRSEHTKMER